METITLNDEWFRHFFEGAAVDFWVAVAPPPDDDVAFLQSVFTGSEILDVACGAGRHTIPLVRAGCSVTGVDISPEFLSKARSASAGLPVEWRESDMRDLPWRERFDGVLCFGNSFGYLGRAGTREFVAAAASSMKHGAYFVLETGAAAESLLPHLQERRWIEAGGILFLSAATYEVAESRLDVEYTFVRGGVRETKTARTSVFTTAELREMFAAEGLEVEAMYASTAREPFRLGSPRLILIARKS